MVQNEHAPDSIRFVHGMEHKGLSPGALAIERSRAFKKSFVATLSARIGFTGRDPEILRGAKSSARLDRLVASFAADGHPPEEETRNFLAGELAERSGDPELGIGEQIRDCCVRWPPDWLNCGGYIVTRAGGALTAEAAVADYERTAGAIADPAIRAELAAIRVYAQIEWEISL